MKGLADLIFGDIKVEIYEFENRVVLNGKEIESNFWYPRGGVIAAKKIYITDSYHHTVKVFDTEGKFIKEFGSTILQEPHGITECNGYIFICDKDNGYIRKFDYEGNMVGTFSQKMRQPIVITTDGTYLYVADTNGNRVYIFTTDGEIVGKIEKNLKYPAGICVSKEYIYISSQFDKKINRYSKEGIFVDVFKNGEYFSILKIYDNKIYYYDEKNGIMNSEELAEERFDEEEYFAKGLDKREEGYYFINKDINRAASLFKDSSIWDKEREEENIKIAPVIDSIEFYEFIMRYSSKKELFYEKLNKSEYFIKLDKIIKNVSDDKLEKPKAIFKIGNEIYVSLFTKKILAKISEEAEIKGYYTSDIQIDKLAATDEKVYFIDYFYKRFYVLDIKTEETAIFSESVLESPLDLRMIDNKLWVLDSVLKEIVVFDLKGKVENKIKIDGIEPVSFDKRENLYVLDKRTGEIHVYDKNFKKSKIIENKNNMKFPDGLAIDDIENIYLTDEGNNKILKYNSNGDFIFELKGFAMPKDIFYDDGRIFISDYANDSIKIYKVR